MIKTSLNDTYICGTNTTELENEASTCHQIYYNKDNWFMFNESINGVCTHFFFKVDALPQDVAFPLDI